MKAKILLSFILCCFSLLAPAQTLQELLELHRKNYADLAVSRGIQNFYRDGVSETHLVRTLKEYVDNVGILLYTSKEDTLTITLIKKDGQIISKKQGLKEVDLKERITKANLWFSRNAISRAPVMRGVEVQAAISKPGALEKAFSEMNEQLLPFKEELKKLDHLIIVPVLNIATLPFAAFRLDSTQYLIDRMSFSIAPSIFEIMVSKKMNTNTLKEDALGITMSYSWENALFVANPKYANNTRWQFPDLPGAVIEIKNITKALDAAHYKIIAGEKATYASIMDSIATYDLLYFATHGISDEKDPLNNSFLAITPDKSGISAITAKQIQDLRLKNKLKADLVILSACQTGLGKVHIGGVIGLARAFQIAGARHVLMSLWNINDKETATIMAFFFNFLKEKKTLMPHSALRMAILKYKAEVNKDPNIWAAFALFGIPF